MSDKLTSVPDIPSGQRDDMEDFLNAIKENLEILSAKRSSALRRYRAVTLQDLLDLGLVSENDLREVE